MIDLETAIGRIAGYHREGLEWLLQHADAVAFRAIGFDAIRALRGRICVGQSCPPGAIPAVPSVVWSISASPDNRRSGPNARSTPHSRLTVEGRSRAKPDPTATHHLQGVLAAHPIVRDPG